jgi:triacylglycerol lipase
MDQSSSASEAPRKARRHLVLVPGFVGFDALGTLPYYAGITSAFDRWRRSGAAAAQGASIDYFDNFPTASVALRAQRLRAFLAKKVARGEIGEGTELILAGHSTGGLDIRQLLIDLSAPGGGTTFVDGECEVGHEVLKRLVTRVVFMSVPHYGSNIADYAREFESTLQAFIKTIGIGLQLNREPVTGLRKHLQGVVEGTQSQLLKAVWDALNESDEDKAGPKPDKAGEREARSQLALWLEHMGKDFGALADLCSFNGPHAGSLSPAHASFAQRQEELRDFTTHIRSRSYVTRVSRDARRDFRDRALGIGLGAPKRVAPLLERGFELLNRAAESWTLPLLSVPALLLRGAVDSAVATAAVAALLGKPSLPFDLAHAICAHPALPFRDPQTMAGAPAVPGELARLGAEPVATSELRAADNDGIVNSRSMLWPYDPDRPNAHTFRFVEADHGDIIGHYALKGLPPATEQQPSAGASKRRFYAYDLLQSGAGFAGADFERVWSDVFEFAFA